MVGVYVGDLFSYFCVRFSEVSDITSIDELKNMRGIMLWEEAPSYSAWKQSPAHPKGVGSFEAAVCCQFLLEEKEDLPQWLELEKNANNFARACLEYLYQAWYNRERCDNPDASLLKIFQTNVVQNQVDSKPIFDPNRILKG